MASVVTSNCLVHHEKRSLFQRTAPTLCATVRKCTVFFPLECVCAECVAPVVAINPNLTDTGSKSTFREPWKLTGEDSLPSPRLTSKTRQQWRVQWKTSTFRKNKETWRERERRAGLRLETRHGREAEYQKGMNTKKASICPMHILENSDWM